MKINLMKVASRLRFGYLSDAEARKRGMSMSGFSKLKGAIRKAHKIYELAGGKSKNLKKAILTGKGNRDRKVPLSGFELGSPVEFDDDFTDEFERMVVEMDPDDVESLLEGTIEIEGLGAIATGSAIAAASGAVATVSSLLNKITGVFDKADKAVSTVKKDVRNLKSRASSVASRGRSFVPSTSRRSSGGAAPARIPTVRRLPTRNFRVPTPARKTSTPVSFQPPRSSSTARSIPSTSAARTTALVPQTTQVQNTEESQEKENFFQKNKKPLLIGAGVLIVGGGVYYAVKQSKKGKKSKSKSVDGIPRDSKGRFKGSGKSKRKTSKRKSSASKKKEMVPTALL